MKLNTIWHYGGK